LGVEFCDVSALQAQNKITGQSRQILFEGSHPKPRTYIDSFVLINLPILRDTPLQCPPSRSVLSPH